MSNFKVPYIFWVDSVDFYPQSELVKELPQVELYECNDVQKQPFI